MSPLRTFICPVAARIPVLGLKGRMETVLTKYEHHIIQCAGLVLRHREKGNGARTAMLQMTDVIIFYPKKGFNIVIVKTRLGRSTIPTLL